MFLNSNKIRDLSYPKQFSPAYFKYKNPSSFLYLSLISIIRVVPDNTVPSANKKIACYLVREMRFLIT